MWWDQGALNLGACRAAYTKEHRRYCRAVEDGDRREIRKHENWLLKSHTAKTLAVAHAARKKKYPLYPAKLDMMASMLSCWERPTKLVTLYFKKKSNGGVRPIFKYGVMWAAQQYLVLWVLAPRLPLHEGQYGVPGRDRTAAVERAKQLIAEGYHWVIRGDITNCYPSMNGKKVVAMLPGPRAVLRQVLLPPTEEYLLSPYGYAPHTLKARQGLPPGAASTPWVAAAALASVLEGLPDDVVVILYVDDFAIFASSKAAAVHTKNTLREALWAAPVGDLQLKFCNIHHVANGFEFLGYHVFLDENEGPIARPFMADFHKLDERLSAMGPWFGPLFDTVDEVLSFMQSKTPSPASPSSSGFMPKTSAELHAEKVACLLNWRCSYAAWDGDEYGDEVLIALLSNHFAGDLERLVELIHLRAQITRMKALPA